MPANKDSIRHTVTVALVLCVVCSVIVSTAAVVLKPRQEANKLLDRNRNILTAAGMFDEGEHGRDDIARLFAEFKVRAVNLDSGMFAQDDELAAAGIDLEAYNQRAAARDVNLSMVLSAEDDSASIKRRARYALVYVLEKQDHIDRVVLPIHGYGLWGTLYGFIALKGDGQTVVGLGFYEHKETPGLGAEVDNPRWKSLWPGKEVYDQRGGVAVRVVKGKANPDSVHDVDGLSGATLTSQGVDNMMRFWMGDLGFGPFLSRLRREEA